MGNDNDKLDNIIKQLNYLEKEILEKLARIEKHLGIEKPTPVISKPEPVEKKPSEIIYDRKKEAKPPESTPKIVILESANIPSVESPAVEQKDATPKIESAIAPTLQATSNKEILSIESRIGMKYFNWIGVIVLILGIAFFLKYAFDNEWIGPIGRVIIGIIIGLSLIVGGHYSTTKKYKLPAWGLMGGGLAILYLSIFATFGFYHLVGQVPAFGFMILVTITGVTLSVRYNTVAIAVLALIGGFLTPILLSTGKDNQIALFSYIALLDIGIFVTAYFKKWRLLDYLAFIFTVLIFFGWYSEHYREEKLFKAIFFLSVFFLIFAFLSFFHNIIHRKKTNAIDLLLLLGTPAWYFGTAYGLMHITYKGYMGLYDLLMVAIYMGMARIAQLRNKDDNYLILLLLGISLTFLTLAVPIQLEHKWITIAWAVESAILIWISFQTHSLATRIGGLIVLGLVFIRLLFIESNNIDCNYFNVILNERFLTFLVALAGFFSTTYLYVKHKHSLGSNERQVFPPLLSILTILICFWLINMEMVSYYNYSQWAHTIDSAKREGLMHRVLSISWAFYALVLVIFGILGKMPLIRWLSFILFASTIIKVFFYDLAELEAIYRITSFIVLGAILIGVSFLYQKFIKRISKSVD
ncbi:MAG: DUF2339 domain-containing protein [Planctomycetota bacterium]